jgi:hypothetical protein
MVLPNPGNFEDLAQEEYEKHYSGWRHRDHRHAEVERLRAEHASRGVPWGRIVLLLVAAGALLLLSIPALLSDI